GGNARDHALVMGRPGDGGELVTGAIRDLHPGTARERHHLGQWARRAREDSDLVGPPATTFEECTHRISPEENVTQRRGVRRGPLGVSSTDHPSSWIALRSSSERRQAGPVRASERSLTRRSTSAGGPTSAALRAKSPRAPPRRLTSSTPATSAC